MKRRSFGWLGIIGLLVLAFSAAPALAQLNPDACSTNYSAIKSAPIAISTATTTEIVPAVAGKTTYACGLVLQNGTSSTAQIEYGTKASTACDTGATALTGVMLASTSLTVGLGAGTRTLMQTPAGNELCIVSTGTGGSVGWLDYIQQ